MDNLIQARSFDKNTVTEQEKQNLPGLFVDSRLVNLTEQQITVLIQNIPTFVNSPQRASFIALRLCDFTSSHKFQIMLAESFDKLQCLSQADYVVYYRLLSQVSISHIQLDSLSVYQKCIQGDEYSILSAARFSRNSILVAQLLSSTSQEIEFGKINNTQFLNIAVENLRKPFTANFTYASIILLWVLAKQSDTISNYFINNGCVGLLCRMLKSHDVQISSKVVRSILLGLKTLNSNRGVEQMIASELQIVLRQLQQMSWPEGIEGPLKELYDEISGRIKDISTIENYRSQIEAGVMELTPLHHSILFWKQNCQTFTADGGNLLKQLAQVGSAAIKNQDNTTIKVVLNDIGQFAVNHPTGREFLQKVPMILQFSMQCMQILDEEIQSMAISTVAKMLVVDWKAI
ncbi:Vacuolar ATP synthase subunit H [Spironucleus salmonicida]|uniref:Vacuolar ATP synthase subunit H n=1 Tax=Spironucleus salmonicida TaxID=348837 RepID=V6LXY0_9EUKA|nr:Vacuolar ATP synthase subunit H [Spironucleus salmonicida]|eukprot:EST45654.1 Vacuolar ATP synthase subunit H [Spironucleus salmonicida]